MAHAPSIVKVGLIAPGHSGVPEALEGMQTRFVWALGRQAWRADVLLWIVDVSQGIPEGTRERFRSALEAGTAPPLVVYLRGEDPVEVPASEILELGIRELLADLELKADAVPVLRGVGELAAVLVAQAAEAKPSGSRWDVIEESPRRGDDYSVARGALELRETPDAWIVPVFYGTDRDRTRSPEPAKLFGTGRGPLSFGWAEVSLPKQRDKGELPAPAWWKRWQRRDDPSRFVLLLSVHPLEREPFVAELKTAVEKADVPEALVFIHGFNVSFEEAAERAAQVAFDLEFQGVPMVFSWPSEGNVLSYAVDENNIEWSSLHFEEFLRLVLAESGARTVHVIAHSMGNRALVRVLAALQAETAAGGARLRQVVFAAPDVDRGVFEQIAAKFYGRAERFTLYGSSNDRALQISKKMHRYSRAGDSGEDITLVQGIDSIDASQADTSLLGHSAFSSRRSILSDISYLIREGLPPERRFGLSMQEREKRKYWVYQP